MKKKSVQTQNEKQPDSDRNSAQGVYYAHLATCEVCNTVHDLEEIHHDAQEPDYSKEDLIEARQYLDEREVEGGV